MCHQIIIIVKHIQATDQMEEKLLSGGGLYRRESGSFPLDLKKKQPLKYIIKFIMNRK